MIRELKCLCCEKPYSQEWADEQWQYRKTVDFIDLCDTCYDAAQPWMSKQFIHDFSVESADHIPDATKMIDHIADADKKVET